MKKKTPVEPTEFPTTKEIRELAQITSQLQELYRVIIKPVRTTWFGTTGYDMPAISEVTRQFSVAKARLWEKIYDTYPQTRKGDWTCGSAVITKS